MEGTAKIVWSTIKDNSVINDYHPKIIIYPSITYILFIYDKERLYLEK